jgi:hypothetical protein
VPDSDFHLKTGSPALDAGTATDAPSYDVDGNPRPVGAGFDIGAYESQLPSCGDGTIDTGEQCGEPGLSCSDPCTACMACICAQLPPVCGDGKVCGMEQCEVDADCGSGQVCHGCQCENASACDSGIVMLRPKLRVRATPFSLRMSGSALIPKPWHGVNPLLNGVRIVVDALAGPGGFDVTIPGGALTDGVGWTIDRTGHRWTYRDPSGTHGGVTHIRVRDRSPKQDGLVDWSVRGKTGGVELPAAAQVRTAVVVGDSLECTEILWNPPGSPRPRCDGTAARLVCR